MKGSLSCADLLNGTKQIIGTFIPESALRNKLSAFIRISVAA